MVLRRASPEEAPLLAALVDEAYGHYVERIGTLPRPMTLDYARYVKDYEVTASSNVPDTPV
jgi:hypothetical protein